MGQMHYNDTRRFLERTTSRTDQAAHKQMPASFKLLISSPAKLAAHWRSCHVGRTLACLGWRSHKVWVVGRLGEEVGLSGRNARLRLHRRLRGVCRMIRVERSLAVRCHRVSRSSWTQKNNTGNDEIGFNSAKTSALFKP